MSALWARMRRPTRFIVGTTLLGTGVYGLDARTEAQLIQRNIRTFYNGIALAVDYKLNFRPSLEPDSASRIESLHERVANRIFDVFERNGGLYIKVGQVIGTQSAVLPPAYQRRARRLYDAAPALPFEVVERVFREDFNGLHPSQVFSEFEMLPVASASIAQVHRARLHSGEVVAVKIQKPAILKQMDWDLLAFRILLQVYERLFDLPLSWSSDYIEKHIRMETDFISEASNTEKAKEYFNEEATFRDRVYVPKVYHNISSKRVLVSEWVDGVQVTDAQKLKAKNLNLDRAMYTTIEAFSSQIFKSGFVHGDPHPGNVLVRKHPTIKDDVQVVIIDHGLYIQESEKFRLEYCKLWEALFMLDMDTMNRICKSWGIEDSNMFASITLQKPFSPNKAVHLGKANVNMQDIYELQVSLKDRIKNFLKDQALFPRELIFVSRNMNIVRANNKALGSPVNRINVMARWALRGLAEQRNVSLDDNQSITTGQKFRSYLYSTWRLWLFDCTLMVMSVSFWLVKLRDKTNRLLYGSTSQGFEEVLDQKLKEQLQQQFGIVIDESLFDA
ncbi:ABC1 family-domain-containing protein [Zychaea mexicana]|uniref:ABC1 family-domain-containing protein n=1 Tax=Zychaea mexicana TaxID=64656 RepID=UPI0022FDD9EB|nr:ABC1 family-domain-containing protein [Zychaea mexicana]KAI9495197.1 ABC1 family-domain-containing protein [Zychaea mexicana]